MSCNQKAESRRRTEIIVDKLQRGPERMWRQIKKKVWGTYYKVPLDVVVRRDLEAFLLVGDI